MNKTYSFTQTQTFSTLLVKKVKIILIAAFVIGAWGQVVLAQTNGDYQTRTTVTGNWNGNATWQQYVSGVWTDVATSPTSSDGVISIRSGATVTVNGSVTVDQLSVAGTLTISGAGQTLTIADGTGDDITVTGTVTITSGAINVSANAKWVHSISNALPNCTWTSGSTLEVTGNYSPTNFNQSFANVIWNSSGSKDLTSATSFNIQSGNTFEIKAGSVTYFGNTGLASKTQTWSGNLSLSGGSFTLLNNPAAEGYNVSLTVNDVTISSGTLHFVYAITNTNGNDITLDVNGSLTLSGGTIDLYYAANTGSNSYATLNLNSSFYWSGGTIKRTNATASGPYTKIDFTGTGGAQNFTQTLGSTTYTTLGRTTSWAETGSSTLNVNLIGTSGTTLSSLTSLTGNLTVNCSGTATLGATTTANGIVYMTQGTLSGTLTYGASASLNYNGITDQTTGPEWPASFAKPVTISNTGGIVTLGRATTVAAGGSCKIDLGATLATGAFTFASNTGTVTVNGTFQVDQGGYGGNTGTYTYHSLTGTLAFTNSSNSYGVASDAAFWPTTSGPPNVNVKGAGGITLNAARSVSGTFQTSAAITNANNLTLNGIAQINTNGYLVSGTPAYGGSSTLIYNTASFATTTKEFPATGVKNVTITASSGTNTVTLDGDKTISGTLAVGSHILNGGKSINAATITIGSGSMVMGDITTSTALTCSGASVISLSGAWSVTGFTKSASTVTFTEAGNINNTTSFYNLTNSAGNRSITQNIEVENTLAVTGGQMGVTGGSGRSLTMSGAASSININGGAIYGTDAGTGNDLSLIISGTQTTLTGNATAGHDDEKKFFSITVNNSKKLILQRGILCKYGTFTCDGTIQVDANGYVQNDVSYGANAKSPAYNATTGSLIYNNGGSYTSAAEWPATNPPFNVTIQNAGTNVIMSDNRAIAGALTISNGSLIVSSAKSLTVVGALTNNAGNTGLVVNSGGSLIETTAGVNATIKRDITKYTNSGDKMFHFLSSPVSEQLIRTEFVTSPATAGQDFYSFSETTNMWINSKDDLGSWNGSFESTFGIGKGYMVAYSADVTKNFTGTLNTYPSGLVLNCTNTPGKGNGWNLLGNPFPSAIDWNYVNQGNGMDNALYYYDNTSQNYRYHLILSGDTKTSLGSGSQFIPAMQGFMVHARTSGTKTITLSNAARTHTGQTVFYKSSNTVPGSLSLKVAANGFEDETFVYFNANATNSFDGQYDAYKLRSYNTSVPALYTHASDGSELAINGLPEIAENSMIPVSFVAGMDGEYTLTANLQNMPNALVYLIDSKLNITQNLSANAVYTFMASTTDQPSRFKLTFNSVGIIEPGNAETLRIYMEAGSLYVSGSFATNTEIRVANMLGQVVLRGKTNGNALTSLNANSLPNGVYVVSLLSGSKSVSRKIVVNQ